MPCSDGGYTTGEPALSMKRVDRLSNLLCEACKLLDKSPGTGAMSKALAKWWRQHQKRDAERVAREKEVESQERLRKKILKKLTPKERKALGV